MFLSKILKICEMNYKRVIIFSAVQSESQECVRLLIRKDANINARVYTGYTPLHLAAEKGHFGILQYLINHGANITACADDDLTPLFLTAQFGRTDCLKLLLKTLEQKGLRGFVNKTALDGATPVLIAAQEGHEECISLLLDCGADVNIPVKDFKAVAAHYAIFKNRPSNSGFNILVSLRWKLLPTPSETNPQFRYIPYQRYGHTAVAHEDCAYIWGGRNDKDGACNVLHCFDCVKLAWCYVKVEGPVPNARDGHSACVIHDKMYIFGGYEEEVDRFSNEIHTLDFKTLTWSPLKPVVLFDTLSHAWQEPVTQGIQPIGRRSHSAFIYDGYLYIFGGYNGLHDIHFRDVFRFDPGKFLCHGYLYIFGGYNGLHDIHFRDVFRFDPVNMRWSIVKVKGQGPCARRRQCCCVIGSRVYLFGGTSPPDGSHPHFSHTSEFDLIDHSDLHILDFAPSLKTLCKLSVLDHKLDKSCLPKSLR
ncbi:hypothetical protein KUTeg_014063 [Tegillarca granosa]|uniref:Uncharacterized protein n=1 Tax=Tegillarca granosa TaxID=220873 RepID=A0ABQ9EVJ6_TEGGR|nr:hypothetical protein KUTeg_014063 [Tegillarca granosa]